MCVIDLDEVADAWHEKDVKARKHHACSCCRRDITPGETYLTHWSLFDGQSQPGKLCGECGSDRAEFAEAHELTPHPAAFVEMLDQCIAEDDDESLRTWGAMRDRIRARCTGQVPV